MSQPQVGVSFSGDQKEPSKHTILRAKRQKESIENHALTLVAPCQRSTRSSTEGPPSAKTIQLLG